MTINTIHSLLDELEKHASNMQDAWRSVCVAKWQLKRRKESYHPEIKHRDYKAFKPFEDRFKEISGMLEEYGVTPKIHYEKRAVNNRSEPTGKMFFSVELHNTLGEEKKFSVGYNHLLDDGIKHPDYTKIDGFQALKARIEGFFSAGFPNHSFKTDTSGDRIYSDASEVLRPNAAAIEEFSVNVRPAQNNIRSLKTTPTPAPIQSQHSETSWLSKLNLSQKPPAAAEITLEAEAAKLVEMETRMKWGVGKILFASVLGVSGIALAGTGILNYFTGKHGHDDGLSIG